jgi:glutaminyl-peptide cyclotransferase
MARPSGPPAALTRIGRPVAAVVAAVCALALGGVSAPSAQRAAKAPKAPVDKYRVVQAYPHDPSAYTQGLVYRDGFLFESTGLNGRSTLRKVRVATGEVVQQRRIDPAYFAEGLADWRGQLVQLTWQSNVAFVYDLAGFTPRGTFAYPGEGWGLTRNDDGFIMSDGSADLRFLDPGTFREVRRVTVTDGGVPVRALNELEYVRGEVWANVYMTDLIARIDPKTGRVLRWIDLRGLMANGYNLEAGAVLNGIAYDPGKNRLWVTGKLWPRLFEIEVVPAAAKRKRR